MNSDDSSANADLQQFDDYMMLLSGALGHADRVVPFRSYSMGLILPGERKSVEPMSAQIDPRNVRKTHQSLHHFVATSAWSDEAVIARVREAVFPVMQAREAIRAWIIDDTGIPKKGKHSVGVSHQYCGQLGKQANCQVAVSLSIANTFASLPIAYRLYMPDSWFDDEHADRRKACGVPSDAQFFTKPQIALQQISEAVSAGIPQGRRRCRRRVRKHDVVSRGHHRAGSCVRLIRPSFHERMATW